MADVFAPHWLPPTYGQNGLIVDQGAYLARAMLEPIMEETSDDDEHRQLELWSQHYDSAWSSESETGSVIRVGLNQGE